MSMIPAGIIAPPASQAAGPYGGMNPPRPVAGMSVWPYGYNTDANTFAVSANIIYLVPYPIFETTTFAGARFKDSGAGNNGKNVRIGLWSQGASGTGGLGTLLKDWGQTTLTGAGGLHSVASSVTVTGPQMCYIGTVYDSTPTMCTMDMWQWFSGVGMFVTPPLMSMLGDVAGGTMSANVLNGVVGWTATFTYGALASGTAITANITGKGASSSTGVIPAMTLYL